MPRYFLTREGIDADRFFGRLGYAQHHDATLARVASGEADAGMVNSAIALRALGSGGQYERALRVLWASPSFVNYVWAVRRDLPAEFRQRLAEAFFNMNIERPEHVVALRAQTATGFLPALPEDYEATPAAMRAAGLR